GAGWPECVGRTTELGEPATPLVESAPGRPAQAQGQRIGAFAQLCEPAFGSVRDQCRADPVQARACVGEAMARREREATAQRGKALVTPRKALAGLVRQQARMEVIQALAQRIEPAPPHGNEA